MDTWLVLLHKMKLNIMSCPPNYPSLWGRQAMTPENPERSAMLQPGERHKTSQGQRTPPLIRGHPAMQISRKDYDTENDFGPAQT